MLSWLRRRRVHPQGDERGAQCWADRSLRSRDGCRRDGCRGRWMQPKGRGCYGGCLSENRGRGGRAHLRGCVAPKDRTHLRDHLENHQNRVRGGVRSGDCCAGSMARVLGSDGLLMTRGGRGGRRTGCGRSQNRGRSGRRDGHQMTRGVRGGRRDRRSDRKRGYRDRKIRVRRGGRGGLRRRYGGDQSHFRRGRRIGCSCDRIGRHGGHGGSPDRESEESRGQRGCPLTLTL